MAKTKQEDTFSEPNITLSQAVRIVNEAIKAEEDRLNKFASATDGEPVMLEGETTTGYYVHAMVDSAKAAKIMLDYWFPMYTVLEEEAPQEMWDALARMVGLANVFSIDL